MLIRILITAAMLVALYIIPVTGWLRLALYLTAYLVIGYDILKKAGQGIANGRVFDENFPDGRGYGGRVRAGHL